MTLRENIDTNYLGGTIGAAVEGAISDRWSVGFRGAVSLYDAKSKYDGVYDDNHQEDATRLLTTKTLAHAAALDVSLDRHISDNITLGVTLGVDYLSDSPQMLYPGPVTAPDNDDVKIGFSELISMTAGASLSIRF